MLKWVFTNLIVVWLMWLPWKKINKLGGPSSGSITPGRKLSFLLLLCLVIGGGYDGLSCAKEAANLGWNVACCDFVKVSCKEKKM